MSLDYDLFLSSLFDAPLLLVAVGSAAVALILLLLAGRSTPCADGECVVLDGSNLLHWRNNSPDVTTLKIVLAKLRAEGLTPCVIFDANAGYLLQGRYMAPKALAGLLGLPVRQVSIVPKGQPADGAILHCARSMRARVVSNDRFRDWAADFPEVEDRSRFIRGGFEGGDLWLSLNIAPRGPERKTPAQALRRG